MRKPGLALLAFGLAPALLQGAAYQVVVEVQDPRGKPFAEPVQKLCEEWYPKFNEALFGPDYELPFKEVKVIFAGEIVFQQGKDRVVIPAYTDGNTTTSTPNTPPNSTSTRPMIISAWSPTNSRTSCSTMTTAGPARAGW